jgi:hypothetical protein
LARGYAVSIVGFEEEKIRLYIRQQEQLDGKGYSVIINSYLFKQKKG